MSRHTNPSARHLLAIVALEALLLAACRTPGAGSDEQANPVVPDWSQDIVWYQIFPERFRNGDASNDPTRASLEFPEQVPDAWRLTPWTADWYARDTWERERGADFYENGVFDRRLGGDLQGVIDGLDYLEELGITGIYFNPVFYGRSLHKYDGASFHHIDPYFGPDPVGDLALIASETAEPITWTWTAADKLFLTLVREAHRRGIHLVIDGVFNHTGRDFFAFKDLMERQEESPYADWYIIKSFDDPATPENEFAYKGWWDVATLPEFANNEEETDLHAGPKAYVFAATRRWLDPNGDGDPSDGIDGWRLDVAEDVPIGFWKDWNEMVRQVSPHAYTVTEIWHDASSFLAQGGFSATMNYFGFAWPVKGYLIDAAVSPTEFGRLLDERRAAYPDGVRQALMNLIDSHDTDRLASMIVNRRTTYEEPERFDYDGWGQVSPRNTDRYQVRAPRPEERAIQRLVALFQMTYVGAPMIYYGTEAGMWGADDPDDRKPMLWPDLAYDDERADPLGRSRPQDSVRFDRGLFDFYASAIKLRSEHAALREGDYRPLVADDESGTFAFARSDGAETLVVVLNRSESERLVKTGMPMTGAKLLLESGAPGGTRLDFTGGLAVGLPPLSGAIVAVETPS